MRGADGTAVRAWCNDGDGPAVLLCNDLGAPPAAWPGLVARDSGHRVLTLSYRGPAGSDRPADPARVLVEDHADDARAVLDAFEVPEAVLIGWSLGSTSPSSCPGDPGPGAGGPPGRHAACVSPWYRAGHASDDG